MPPKRASLRSAPRASTSDAGPSAPLPAQASHKAAHASAASPDAPPPVSPATSTRTLRARASDTAPGPSRQRTRTVGSRVITAEEEERALWKLGPEGTAARRDEVVHDLEARVRRIVEEHDMAVKEKFHLERYISILEGWNPQDAKDDNSSVFLEYKHTHHDLLSLVPTEFLPSASEAGPSRRRSAGPARTTRRQLHRKSEALGHVTALTSKEKEKAAREAKEKEKNAKADGADDKDKASSKGKGRASVEPEEDEESAPSPAAGPSKRKAKAEMPPPPVPGRKSRRVTTHGAVEPEAEDEEEDTPKKGRKRGARQSLPIIPAKRSRARGTATSASSPASSPAPTTPAARSPTPEPVVLPSLAHVPFPPPPARPQFRRSGPSVVKYTDPNQRPPPPKFDGDANAFLESYIHLEDTGPPLDLAALEARAAREGYLRNRVNYLQHQGRLMRLLDEDVDAPPEKRNTRHDRKVPTGPPPRQTDYQDSLMAHMIQVRNAMVAEAKMKPVVCRKIARMIQLYWEHILTKDERERAAEERERKRRAKEVVKALKKRWGLAIKIVRAKVRELQKIEQDRLGKEHLQNMLQRSTGLLEGQRDAMTGRELDEDEDRDSDGTADVSAAEDSEAEGDDEALEAGEAVDGVVRGGEAEAEAADEEEDDEGEDEEEGDDESESDEEPMARIDYHTMLGIKPEEMIFEEGQESTAADEPTPTSPAADDDGQPVDAASAEVTTNVEVPPPDSEDSLIVPPGPSAPVDSASSAVSAEPSAMSTEAATALPADAPLRTSVPAPETSEKREPARSPSPAVAPSSPPARYRSPTPPPRAPSRRLARKARALAAAAATPDPDANDTEFHALDTDAADARLDEEMDDLKADGGDSEDEGLLADAEVPIEELLKRYGYPMPSADTSDAEVKVEAKADDEVKTETGEDTAMDVDEGAEEAEVSMLAIAAPSSDPVEPAEPSQPNGTAAELPTTTDSPSTGAAELSSSSAVAAPNAEGPVDQSLTDEALATRRQSPPLIIEGKRQRKVRTVWSPPAHTPQHAVSNKPRKPKIQPVEPEVEPSPEPEPSEEEVEEESEDEEMSEDASGDETQEVEEDPNAPRIRPPFLLRGTLRPYQQAGLEWLASLYANNMNGILADEMGLGKTIQTISLLGHLACDKGVWGPHLIIVPTSVILNWEMEFKKFLPGMKVLTYYGNQKERKEKRVGWNTENAWQVCITSYQIVLADQHIFRRKNWVYMILDEAHNIKNFRSQRWQTLLGFKTQRRLLLTGTPLQNNLMELWSLLYFLMPNGITADATAVVGFANHRDFMEWFSNPMDKAVETGDTLDEETIETVGKLHTLLRPFILRRLKSDVETQLPGKFEHVVYCRLSKRQRFLYDEFMSRASTREALSSGGYMGVMNTLMQLRKVCNHPDLFEVRPVKTSFAMERGVLSDFEPLDLLIRRRLLSKYDELDLDDMGFLITKHEDESGFVARARQQLDASDRLPYAMEDGKKFGRAPKPDLRTVAGWQKYRAFMDHKAEVAKWQALRDINRRRCTAGAPMYGRTTLSMFVDIPQYLLPESVQSRRRIDWFAEHLPPAAALVQSLPDRLASVTDIVNRFAVIPPNAVARDVANYALPGMNPLDPTLQDPTFDTLHTPSVKLQIAFPDVSLLQYDCGKLQKLAEMLRDLKADGHRVLIFTQMTRVLDILEIFLSYNGHRYLRLDGSTKIEDRQVLTERFNSDPRIFCFIASSRSGGVGINLTGADTVFFYDSDWNPSMDRQCMDRAHRIGQTREVHIYRFVSSHTVEENMLKKANQKRLLDRVVIQEGEFTTDFFGKMDWRDMLDDTMVPPEEEEDRIEDVEVEEADEADIAAAAPRMGKERELALALAQVEDEEDAAAARVAQGEGEMDFADFGDEGKRAKKSKDADLKEMTPVGASNPAISRVGTEPAATSASGTPAPLSESATPFPDEWDDDEPGAIDEYMLRYVEWEWDTYFCNM